MDLRNYKSTVTGYMILVTISIAIKYEKPVHCEKNAVFNRFIMQIILLFSVNLLETITVLVDKRLIYSVVTFFFFFV